MYRISEKMQTIRLKTPVELFENESLKISTKIYSQDEPDNTIFTYYGI